MADASARNPIIFYATGTAVSNLMTRLALMGPPPLKPERISKPLLTKKLCSVLIRHQKPLAMPLQVEEDSPEESEAWVTAVEPGYEQEQTSEYAGYMRIPLP
ncbi:hypothetical protein N7465_010019 [Penicillium sp. CMV-2018d]|nr:hypothetical protein N7465_010019 [Penicillium sp. CMV-2018d]